MHKGAGYCHNTLGHWIAYPDLVAHKSSSRSQHLHAHGKPHNDLRDMMPARGRGWCSAILVMGHCRKTNSRIDVQVQLVSSNVVSCDGGDTKA